MYSAMFKNLLRNERSADELGRCRFITAQVCGKYEEPIRGQLCAHDY